MAQRVEVTLSDEAREVLERWARRPKSSQALALRCRIVLSAPEGESSRDIAARLGCNADTVGKWRARFARRGFDGLHDEPRPGKPRSIGDDDIERVIVKTLEESPPNATHWSTRSMAAATGMSQSAISRIWRAFALKPHRTEAFKLSPDPQFIEKVRDIVGLYLNPPDAAVVLCVDEKSQIQALDRTAPVLPLLEPDRALGARAARRPRRARQLLDPQDSLDPALAHAPPALHAALHAHLQLVAEPRRALVRRADDEVDHAWHPSVRPRPRRLDPHLDRQLERAATPLRLAQERRGDPRHSRVVLPADQRFR